MQFVLLLHPGKLKCTTPIFVRQFLVVLSLIIPHPALLLSVCFFLYIWAKVVRKQWFYNLNNSKVSSTHYGLLRYLWCCQRRVGTSPIDLYHGACYAFEANGGTEEAFLCFAPAGKKQCHSLWRTNQISFQPNFGPSLLILRQSTIITRGVLGCLKRSRWQYRW